MRPYTGISKMLRRITLLLLFIPLAACSGLIFQPTKQHLLKRDLAEQRLQIKIKDVYFQSGDGTKLHGWLLPNQEKETKGTVLFLHGNGENISTHIRLVWWLPRSGYNVFMPDYRGYGISEGEPTLERVHEDIQAAMGWLFSQKDLNLKNVILYGQSLGGALATTSLADSPYRERFKGLVVEGSFTRYRQVAQEMLGKSWLTWLFQWPLSFTIRDDYSPIETIPRISPIPVLLAHGDADPIVDMHHSQLLYTAAQQPKELWIIPGAGHAVFWSADQRQRLLDYFDKILITNKK